MKDAETKLQEMELYLEAHAFTYRGGGIWHDAVTSLTHPTSIAYKILHQRMHPTPVGWTRDIIGDYNIEIADPNKNHSIVRGKIIKCAHVKNWPNNKGKDGKRWLLLVNDSFYGFWETFSQAKKRFETDCVPKSKAEPVADDPYGEYYCWHGDKPYGPGPYCTGCGGLIKKKTICKSN